MSWALALTTVTLLAAVIAPDAAPAALLPAVSEQLTGQPAPDFQADTVDGGAVTSEDFRGKALLVNFFASWCPACQMEIGKLRKLQPEFRARGVSVIGIMVDPVETPDTVDEALHALRQNPLPYPVLMMTPALRDAFHFEGFPATYFITGEGTFSTTLLGNHPSEEIRDVAMRVAGGTDARSSNAAPRPAEAGGLAVAHREWETQPWRALVPVAWKQWHPLVVHFPIALLVIEAVCVWAYWLRPSERVAWCTNWLLWTALISVALALYTGVRDVGAALELPGWPIWNGVKDRLTHLFRLQSSISLHVLFVLAAVLLASTRLVWRRFSGDRALRGPQGFAFGTVALLGLWLLFAAAQIGGGISHP
jgi:uncharacterized membrane protein/thiol-disulfide isomerase/thioredoxin